MMDAFDDVYEAPNPELRRRFDQMVGLDTIKTTLIKEGRLRLNPSLLSKWSDQYHGEVLPAVKFFFNRPPLILFYGDVGTGKSTLAETIADPIAREERITVHVMRLSLNTRGSGAVGEMTQRITRAFSQVGEIVDHTIQAGKKVSSAGILIIDEADALAQSREFEQMHHEDRAGVNALIRGIDRLAAEGRPVLIIMCTNRADAMDPAVLRRAAAQFTFDRPNPEQRAAVFRYALGKVLTEKEIEKLVELTGPNDHRNFGYTYSDLIHRLIPAIMLEAYPDQPITFVLASRLVNDMEPTKPFRIRNGIPS